MKDTNDLKNELKAMTNEISELEKEQSKINKQICELNNKKIKLLQKKCKKNIGRCFKKIQDNKVIGYYKVMDIDKVHCRLDRMDFNEYQYPSLYFEYPYDDSINPFYNKELFSGAWGHGNDIVAKIQGVVYEEISNGEFMEKFNDVNNLWANNVKNI